MLSSPPPEADLQDEDSLAPEAEHSQPDRDRRPQPPRLPAAETMRLLAKAVADLGGEHRAGQEQMALAVARAFETGEHLLVQAGTGTGKSLAYLVPAIMAAQQTERPVIVATATLALQAQLVGRDLPRFCAALAPACTREPTFAIFKGRSNYACLARVRQGVPDEQGVLVEAAPSGPLGREVVALREWAEDEAKAGGQGDRDHAPRHSDRAWAQVSIQARECPGEANCPFGAECFAERSRDVAAKADVVVTIHAMLAIDTLEGIPLLPEYDLAIIDEAHELPARVTSAASMELAAGAIERAARRARPFVQDQDVVDELHESAQMLQGGLEEARSGRLTALGEQLELAVGAVRDAARAVLTAIPAESSAGPSSAEASRDPGRRTARVMVDQVRLVAERFAEQSDFDVFWISEAASSTGEHGGGGAGRHSAGPDRYQRDRGKELRLAPLSVAGLLRERLFGTRVCVLTSATLKLGGDFEALSRQIGLRSVDRREPPADSGSGIGEHPNAPDAGGMGDEAPTVTGDVVKPQPWIGLDVGSPFDYARQAILYTATRLPPPGRDGPSVRMLDELVELMRAAGGRTLGLFSSRRAAETAAEYVRDRLDTIVLCQGDAQLPELGRAFAADASTSLFGTLSLWQGLDVPGDT
jgi:ATP-dependent DNA helicase DinG